MCWKLCHLLYVEFFPCKRNPCIALLGSATASGILFLRRESVLSKGSCEHLCQKCIRAVIPRTEHGLCLSFLERVPLLHCCVPDSCLQLQPSSLPEGEQCGSLRTYPGQPSSHVQFLGGKWSSSHFAGSQMESGSRALALSKSLLSPHFVPLLFLCPFSGQGWTPGSHHCNWSSQNLCPGARRAGATFPRARPGPPLPCKPQGSTWDRARALHGSSIWMGWPCTRLVLFSNLRRRISSVRTGEESCWLRWPGSSAYLPVLRLCVPETAEGLHAVTCVVSEREEREGLEGSCLYFLD